MGGMIAAVERGFPQAEIANSAYHFQRQLETKEKVMVGVNKYQMKEPKRTMDTLYIDRSVEKRQIEKLVALRKKRNAGDVTKALAKVREDAQAGKNLCPSVFEAVKKYATLQEVCDTLRGVYGEYREAGSF
jgi:methylmalonyl-CoA mutase N-terminal domain/subunit